MGGYEPAKNFSRYAGCFPEVAQICLYCLWRHEYAPAYDRHQYLKTLSLIPSPSRNPREVNGEEKDFIA